MQLVGSETTANRVTTGPKVSIKRSGSLKRGLLRIAPSPGSRVLTPFRTLKYVCVAGVLLSGWTGDLQYRSNAKGSAQ